jgi:RNA polymerase sigma-70 factor, ECF subfamily
MPGRETTVASIPSDNAAFDEGPAVATAVLHRGIEANLPNLRRYARSLTRDAVAADDLVQECIARAFTKLHLWRAGTDLRAWLFTILHNQYVSQLRRATLEGTTVEWRSCASALTCAPRQIERLELRDLERAIMSLSEEQRTAVLLLGLTPANYKEIASACGVPVGTIRSRASRGRTALRKLMGLAPPQHSRASRPMRPAAPATMHPEKNPAVDCRSDIDREGGDRPVTRRSLDDRADHTQADQHTHSDIFDVNGRWNPLRQPDLLEGRIDIRSGAGATGVAKGPDPLIRTGQSPC